MGFIEPFANILDEAHKKKSTSSPLKCVRFSDHVVEISKPHSFSDASSSPSSSDWLNGGNNSHSYDFLTDERNPWLGCPYNDTSSSLTKKIPSSQEVESVYQSLKGKKGKLKKNNANNNFFIETECNVPRQNSWSDVKVRNRLSVLAMPKQVHKCFKEEKEISYWITKKPPPVPKEGFTKSVATPRVEQLAKPLYDRGEWKGIRHCHWEGEEEKKKKPDINPKQVDWDRLAKPKCRTGPCFKSAISCVPDTALQFQTTKRLCQLSVPKKTVDCNDYYLWLWNRKPDIQAKVTEIQRLSLDKTDMKDARVLLRCDLDYTEGKPIHEKILDIVPTILYVFKKKARAVIIISHSGQPNGVKCKDLSLEPLMEPMSQIFADFDLVFMDTCIGPEVSALTEDPENDHIFLLENVRFHPEEQGYHINEKNEKIICSKEKISQFRHTLSSYYDVYINEAFTLLYDTESTTNVGDPKKERCYGFHVRKMLSTFNKFIIKTRGHRMVAVVGGTYDQVADVVSSLMGKASEILLGGEIATMFLHAVKGVNIGETECSPYHQKKIKDMMSRARDTGCVVNLPSDLVLEHIDCPSTYFTGHAKDGVDDYYRVVDIGSLTRQCYASVMMTADLLIWYGGMGELMDGTAAIADTFNQAPSHDILTYLLDDQTICYFRNLTANGQVSFMTQKSEVTEMMLHRRTPKGLGTLSPYRKKLKKRPPKPLWVSTKPTQYDKPCMRVCDGLDRLAIDQLDFKDKRVVIRSDLDVVIKNGVVTEDYRLRMAIPSIRYALQCGAQSVVVISSLGHEYGKRVESLSLRPVAVEMARLLTITARDVKFVAEPTLSRVQTILKDSHPGTVLVVENINFRQEEVSFGRDLEILPDIEKVESFCEEISRMGDVYINDIFCGLEHRLASSCGAMNRQRACGFLLRNELSYISRIFNNPPRPFLVILGGCYNKTKISALKSMLREIDELIITGNIAIGFLKVIHNMPTGESKVHPELEQEVSKVMAIAAENEVKVILPVDFVVADGESNSARTKQLSIMVGCPNGWHAVDIGNKTCSLFRQAIRRNKLILWQGVAGLVEYPNFRKGSEVLLHNISTVTQAEDSEVVSIMAGKSCSWFAQNLSSSQCGVSHQTTGGLANMAIVKDKCLSGVNLLTSGNKRQPMTRLAVDDIEVSGSSVLLRAHVNVPINPDQSLADNSGLKMLVPTIKLLQRKGARCITVMGIRGNPHGHKEATLSLMSTKRELERQIKQEVTFLEEGVSMASEGQIQSSTEGKVLLLENLGFHPEEAGWEQDRSGEFYRMPYAAIEKYRKKLGALCDIYVNESLSSLTTCNSSVVGVPAKFHVCGLSLKAELSKIRSFLSGEMTGPFVAVVGSHGILEPPVSKLKLLLDLMDKVTEVLLCGEVAWTYLKIINPKVKLGDTPFDAAAAKLWPRVIRKAKLNNIKLQIPEDFLIDEKVEADPYDVELTQLTPNTAPSLAPSLPPPSEMGDDMLTGEEVVAVMVPVVNTLKQGVAPGNRVMDIGPATVATYKDIIQSAGRVVVMGPAGEFDQPDYDQGSKGIMAAISEAMAESNLKALAFGPDTYQMLHHIENGEKICHVSHATHACVNLICNSYLPGLEALDPPLERPLKKLSIESFNISGKRVLLRLDLDIPMVEGVVLDQTKMEAAIPTIQLLLEKGARSLVIMGHRGNPHGYKNQYLSMEPLAKEFAMRLSMTVNFLPYPCSAKTQEILAEPEEGSVYLMENLKFYPAEEGVNLVKKKKKEESEEEEKGSQDGEAEEAPEEPAPAEPEDVPTRNSVEFAEGEGEEENEAGEGEGVMEEKEDVESFDDEGNDEFVEFSDEEDLDRVMFEKMAPKSINRYIKELSNCGDVFVNDDVADLNVSLTSMSGLGCKKKMCGLRVKKFLLQADVDGVDNFVGAAALSPAPPQGELDDLDLSQ